MHEFPAVQARFQPVLFQEAVCLVEFFRELTPGISLPSQISLRITPKTLFTLDKWPQTIHHSYSEKTNAR